MKYVPKELCPDVGEIDPTYLRKPHVLPACLDVLFPEAAGVHGQQGRHGAGPRGGSAAARVAARGEPVPESHQQNLPAGKLPVRELLQLRHEYPFSNQERLVHPKLSAGALKTLFNTLSGSSSPQITVFISIACEPLVIGQILGLR